MDLNLRLQKSTKNLLYNYCKRNKIKKTSKLNKNELVTIVATYITNNKIEDTLIDFDKTFSKPQKSNKIPQDHKVFKFSTTLFNTPKITEESFKIVNTNSRFVKKYNSHINDYKLQINKGEDIKKSVYAMVAKLKKDTNFQKGDKMRVIVKNPKFNNVISTSLSSNTDPHKIMERVENILTSDESVDINQCEFRCMVVHLPKGGKGRKILNIAEDKRTKTSITEIKNKDNLCCPRAVITALTFKTNIILERELSQNEIKYIRKGRNIQGELAKKLCDKLGRDYEDLFNLDDIKNIENLLNIQINVVCAENFNTVIYKGDKKETIIYLYKTGNHFDVINSITGFHGCSYYCRKCDTKYENKDNHTCKNITICKMCKNPEHEIVNKIYCEKCNRFCFNEDCLGKHNQVCDEFYKCKDCNKILERIKTHECGYFKCKNCSEFVEEKNHECHINYKKQKGGICDEVCLCNEPNVKKDKGCSYSEKYIWFDYEAQQDTGIHIPNLIITQDYNGKKERFENNETFCKWLISKEHRGFTFIAHNSKSYDSHFILKYCIDNGIKPYTIYNGTKIMLLEIETIKLKIIDSLNFIMSPLASFPKTFGLKELKKGYFPHFFNIPENNNYIGPVPDAQYYGFNTMKKEDRNKFLEWHGQKIKDNYIFDFKKEITEYCESDVDILRKGCLELRRQFLEIANIDPFQYITIASVCMGIFRSKYIQEKTLAVVKEDRKDTFSKASITWLNSINNVQHALNGGEVVIRGEKVDGFDKESNTVYQYHGCFWHGCQKCFKGDSINNINKETMGDLHEKTLRRSKQIIKAGYNIVEMWECNWLKSKDYKSINKFEIIEKLNYRDGFYGGRTNAAKIIVEGKQLKYIDVCSLYPTVNYYDYYPVGHSKMVKNVTEYDKNWFGYIKCKVLPPKMLYHPVLPIKDEKLLFLLCKKCFDEKTESCKHTAEERCIIGTWTTIEMNKAIEKGYQVKEIYEVQHFENKSNNLFKEYVKDFMKIKLETSPHDFKTNEEYIKVIQEKLDINLDPNKMQDNPGKRAVAKLCLNSFWGKFGQRLNMRQTEYVNDVKRWYELLLDDKIEITNSIFINEETVQVCYKYKDDFVENNSNINIHIAAFTTANARLRLYEMLDTLGDAVVYYDTDSVVYIDDGNNTIKTGCLLGEWTDELGKGEWIQFWQSTGPKSYYYITNKGKEVMKVKGFTLNYENSLKLNKQGMQKIIKKKIKAINLEYNMITRNSKTKNLETKKGVSKKFKMDYDKRIIKNDFDTIPWGFK